MRYTVDRQHRFDEHSLCRKHCALLPHVVGRLPVACCMLHSKVSEYFTQVSVPDVSDHLRQYHCEYS